MSGRASSAVSARRCRASKGSGRMGGCQAARASRSRSVPPTLPSYECPAMWGVARAHAAMRAGSGAGSPSNTSSRAAPTRPDASAARSAVPSTTLPRAALTSHVPGRSSAIRSASNRWWVRSAPSRTSGTCRLTTSAAARASPRASKPSGPSARLRGGSTRRTRRPRAARRGASRPPTLPTPTTATVRPARASPRRAASPSSAAITHSTTDSAFEPGAEANAMPCAASQAVSTWSVPMVAVPTKRTGVEASRAASTRVTLRTSSTSALARRSGVSAAAGTASTSPQAAKASVARGMPASATMRRGRG